MNTPISSITTGPRQSNMELLRIIAMFMVMVLHADYWSIGTPTSIDYHQNFLSASTRTFFQCLSIISVNVFICISGWFGIKPSIKGLCGFIFQYCFFGILITSVMYAITGQSLNIQYIRECFLIGPDLLWFVKSYLGLYILALPLNYFVQHASKQQFTFILIAFFSFQTIYGLSGGAEFVMGGYSTFSFIGLYLLARYCKVYLNYRNYINLTIPGGIILITNFLIVNHLQYRGINASSLLNYINPVNIFGAISMVVGFSMIKIKPDRHINFIASSAFAVYLVHQAPQIGRPYFRPFFKSLFDQYSGMECLLMFTLALLSIYLIAVILDQPRKMLWKLLLKKSTFIRNYDALLNADNEVI